MTYNPRWINIFKNFIFTALTVSFVFGSKMQTVGPEIRQPSWRITCKIECHPCIYIYAAYSQYFHRMCLSSTPYTLKLHRSIVETLFGSVHLRLGRSKSVTNIEVFNLVRSSDPQSIFLVLSAAYLRAENILCLYSCRCDLILCERYFRSKPDALTFLFS
jgi:hypothetical protein